MRIVGLKTPVKVSTAGKAAADKATEASAKDAKKAAAEQAKADKAAAEQAAADKAVEAAGSSDEATLEELEALDLEGLRDYADTNGISLGEAIEKDAVLAVIKEAFGL